MTRAGTRRRAGVGGMVSGHPCSASPKLGTHIQGERVQAWLHQPWAGRVQPAGKEQRRGVVALSLLPCV